MSDLIDRDATMKSICEKECDALKPCQAECESIWAVKEMPSAQPQWISCSEKLPKTEVLCCDKYGEMIIAYVYEDNTSDTGFSAESETQCMYNCVAWMPLPEPWKEEEE